MERAKRKSIDEQIAEAEQRAARERNKLKMLEQRKAQLDVRQRAKGEKVLIRVLTERLETDPKLRKTLWQVVDSGDVKPEEAAAVATVIGDPVGELPKVQDKTIASL